MCIASETIILLTIIGLFWPIGCSVQIWLTWCLFLQWSIKTIQLFDLIVSVNDERWAMRNEWDTKRHTKRQRSILPMARISNSIYTSIEVWIVSNRKFTAAMVATNKYFPCEWYAFFEFYISFYTQWRWARSFKADINKSIHKSNTNFNGFLICE